MKSNQLNSYIDEILTQLMYLSNDCRDREQRIKIHDLKNTLLSHFPENFEQLQFQGRIEDVLIQINERLENRIIIKNEKLKIHLNFYLPTASDFSMNDVDQLKDCISLYYPQSIIHF